MEETVQNLWEENGLNDNAYISKENSKKKKKERN